MEQILDPEEQANLSKYSDKAFKNFLYSLAALGLQVIVFLLTFYLSSPSGITLIPPIIILLALIFSLIGLVNAIQSFVKKEARSRKKIIGLLGNWFFVLLLATAVLISLLQIISLMNE